MLGASQTRRDSKSVIDGVSEQGRARVEISALLSRARSRPVEGHDRRKLPKLKLSDIVTHGSSRETTFLGGMRHDGKVAGGGCRVKLGKVVMSAGRIGATVVSEATNEGSCSAMYISNMALSKSCIAVSEFDPSPWQND